MSSGCRGVNIGNFQAVHKSQQAENNHEKKQDFIKQMMKVMQNVAGSANQTANLESEQNGEPRHHNICSRGVVTVRSAGT
jgi:hypothetical protein